MTSACTNLIQIWNCRDNLMRNCNRGFPYSLTRIFLNCNMFTPYICIMLTLLCNVRFLTETCISLSLFVGVFAAVDGFPSWSVRDAEIVSMPWWHHEISGSFYRCSIKIFESFSSVAEMQYAGHRIYNLIHSCRPVTSRVFFVRK